MESLSFPIEAANLTQYSRKQSQWAIIEKSKSEAHAQSLAFV